jgi:hypothetical protein
MSLNDAGIILSELCRKNYGQKRRVYDSLVCKGYDPDKINAIINGMR